MPYDELLAQRVRGVLAARRGIVEKKMFGGIGFLLNGNMCCGVWKEFLILRLGLPDGERALEHQHVKEFDITGRAMKGWVMVEPEGTEAVGDLAAWVRKAENFAGTLPAK